MKWIKRLCSFIFLCILITGGILTYQGYTDYREAIEAKSVEEMSAEIESKIVRKIAEMFMAFKIESVLDKDKILELYVNSIFFGNNYYCVADASEGYFGKPPSEMGFDECTLLAGIPNAPTNYNPVASPELAHQRQAQVIEKMKKAGYLEDDTTAD